MRTALRVGLVMALALGATPDSADAQDPAAPVAAPQPWTAEELENLLAPIALYPDPILAQVLIAATFPEQIALAAAYVRANSTASLDEQPWEISVKAVAHYAPVLNMMAEGEDWTVALGQAYVEQSDEVMAAVQSLRRMANAQGNLVSTNEQQVVVEREVIKIVPAQPQVIYVPTYDPAVIYFRPVYVAHAHPAYWSWGVGYPIGVWLSYDFDWHRHRVFYHGWHGGGWVVASRPWIVFSPFYFGPRHTVIVVNRQVVHHRFNPYRIGRAVHRNSSYDRHDRWGGRRDVARNDPRGPGRATPRDDDRRSDGWRDDDRRNNGRRVTPTPTRGATPARTPRTEPRTPRTEPRTPRTAPRTPSTAPRTPRTASPSATPPTRRPVADALRRASGARPTTPSTPSKTSPRPSGSGSTAAPRPTRSGPTAAPRPSRTGSTAAPRPTRTGSTAAPRPTRSGSTAAPRQARTGSGNSARSARSGGQRRN